ncbi:Hsp70/Hsp90 co-chaperone cns1 [Schizosaccharomyces pombe]|uniref:Hsp70/Hsp90 co-chaperone cns1 n=1 Tax=Schizosaccharomyces pombe (strain 972 / ATCC 24843) TaxID=284812 RepID=CNS1_SCHPO|nr:putative HSP chaperone complex subunit Cns1 [Schizosaccharomyces pombe]O13754.1 RecName: Full=Hsp70/Hsp90 co-chaperone cns1 [Schizosaccharomyces pombe 972h-]CAB16559.1 HSP chaperone complex subunit Cns1 (predicted) [Schizosaccharomyces pombe]|eukprot:NP_594238.1 putative HSP chaperone complex subunit Cns1 [Schizosaccharomyces pombe]
MAGFQSSEVDPNTKNKNAEEMFNELNKVPFFMQSLEDVGDESENNVQLDALKALAYEGEPHEVAQNFREHGNECFASKRYKDAEEFYTKALAQKCGDKDIEIACYSNRAACNLLFENYRQVLNDCAQVLQRDSTHAKAYYRSAKALVALKRYDEAKECIRLCSLVHPNDPAILALSKELQKKSDDFEKRESEKKRVAQEKVIAAKTVLLALQERHIKTKTTEHPPDLGDAMISLSTFDDPKSELFFPTILLYPLVYQSDFVPSVSENCTPLELLKTVFQSPAPWDVHQLYNPDSLDVFATTDTLGLIKVGKNVPILKALTHPKVTLIDGLVQLHVVPHHLASDWISSWKKNKQENAKN